MQCSQGLIENPDDSERNVNKCPQVEAKLQNRKVERKKRQHDALFNIV